MIHDPTLIVTCDNPRCSQEIEVSCPFPYTHRTNDSEINSEIEDHGWIVIDEDHFCSQECRDGDTDATD